MSTAGYKAFLEAMGHRVVEHAGIYWFDVYSRIYMSFPFQTLLVPDAIDVRRVLGNSGLALRYPCDIHQGRPSYRIVIDDPGYDLTHLTVKARNQTRRGLERCDVRPISFQELYADGVRLNLETLERQGRKPPPDFDTYWRRYYMSAEKVDGAEAWGAFVNGIMAAYLIVFRMDDVAHILIVRSAKDMLSAYPNNALLFSYIKSVLNDGKVREVSIGMESIQGGMESLDKFKSGLGFKKLPIGQRIEFAPWLAPIIRSQIGRSVRHVLESRFTSSERMKKVVGMLLWYEEQSSFHD